MIDHTGVTVSDPKKSRAFYDAALKPLGYDMQVEVPKEHTGGRVVLGYGPVNAPGFWIAEGESQKPAVHTALRAPSRAAVDAFYAAAMANGGTDNGPPGVRAHYHPNYYAAFVRDPDGHNIEAVCHTP